MAAIDPSAEAEEDEQGNKVPRATLKIIRNMNEDDTDDDDDYDDSDDGTEETDEYLKQLLAADSDESSDEEAEEKHGGPSDPAKSKQARKAKAVRELKKALEEEQDDMDVDTSTTRVNGILKRKGKAVATGEEDSSDDDSVDDDSEDLDTEEFVLCTLDPSRVRRLPASDLMTEARLVLTTSFLHRTTSSPSTSPSARVS
jgi:FK506-binding nuclear protein